MISGTRIVGDFNGDNKLDLAGLTSLGIAAAPGDGAGHFAAGPSYVDGAAGSLALAADVDGDSHLDLVVAGHGIAVLRGDGAARFDAVEALPLAVPSLWQYPPLAVRGLQPGWQGGPRHT